MKFNFIGNGNIVKKYTKKKYTKLKTKINELEIMEKHHYFTQLMIQIAKRNNRRLRKPRHRRSENLDKKKSRYHAMLNLLEIKNLPTRIC